MGSNQNVISTWLKKRINLASLLSLPLVVGTLLLFLAASNTLQVTADQTLSRYWRSSYDILVRPPDSRTPIEEEYNLVRANLVTSINGGITHEQYAAIKALPDVGIAAPIAMVGFRAQPPPVISLVYTYPGAVTSSRGEYEGNYYFRRIQALYDGVTERIYDETFDVGENIGVLPLAPWETWPALTAGIDPEQEARLTGLDATIRLGDSFLDQAVAERRVDGFEDAPNPYEFTYIRKVFPRIVNIQQSYVVTRTAQVYHAEDDSLEWEGTFTNDVRLPLEDLVLDIVNEAGGRRTYYIVTSELCQFPFLTPTQHTPIGRPSFLPDNSIALAAEPQGTWQLIVDPEVYEQNTYSTIDEWIDEPYVLGDTESSFRSPLTHETEACGTPEGSSEIINIYLALVGRYDSAQLFGATTRVLRNLPLGTTYPLSPAEEAELIRSPLNRLPFDTYFLPETVLRYHPDGSPVIPPRQLRPTFNPQGYLASPPTALTTLEAAQTILEREDYISAIRVRVDGVGALDAEAQAKIQRVAEQIVEQTGLEVDIMAGTSPKSVYVYLPGYEDIPPLGWVEEQWVQKGVTTAVSRGFRRADLLLSSAVFGVVGLFLVTSQLLSVLGRTRQWGILRALGWRASTLFRTVLQEALLLGILAGLLALAGGFVAIRYLGLEVPLARLSLLMPVALALYGGGALYPAWRASRMAPIAAVQQGELSGRGPRLGRLSLLGYGLRHLGQQRLRTVLLLLQLTLASALAVLLGAVLIAVQGELYGNLLGQHLYTKVGPTQLAQVGLGLLLAALAVAEVLRTSVAERRREIGVLKALGWRSRTLLRAIMSEAALLGVIGGTLGAVLGTGAFWALYRELPQELLWVVPGGVLLCILVSVLAALWPALQAARIPPAEAVRYE